MTVANRVPSSVVPETPEHRAAMSRQIQEATGLDEPTLERVVRTFYGAARTDPLIGPLFDVVEDWEEHIATITRFWSSVALMTGRYHGQPMMAHIKLPLQPQHFARWLVLFEQTARDICSQTGADLLVAKAKRIAQSLELGISIQRGELPPLRQPA